MLYATARNLFMGERARSERYEESIGQAELFIRRERADVGQALDLGRAYFSVLGGGRRLLS